MDLQPNIRTILESHGSSRPNVFLDLDNTLLSAVRIPNITNEFVAVVGKYLPYHYFEGSYVIFERPYLQEFLDTLFAHCNVSVWSAGQKEYVLFIVKNIITRGRPDRKLNLVMYSDHCDSSRAKYNKTSPKDLRMIYRDIANSSNTFIIDDNVHVCGANPHNCQQVVPFELDTRDSQIRFALQDNQLDILNRAMKQIFESQSKYKRISVTQSQNSTKRRRIY